MLKNYVIVAIRNLKKNIFASSVNIIGLIIAFASFIILFSYVWDEMTYDRFHKKGDRIYFVAEYWRKYDLYIGGSPLLGKTMQAEIPGIEQYSRVEKKDHIAEYKGLKDKEAIAYTDESFLNMFSFDIIRSNSSILNKNLNSVILTEKTAKKYFPNEDPINKELTIIRDSDTLKVFVSGVIKDIPANSSLQFAMIVPFGNLFRASNVMSPEKYFPYHGTTFLKLKDNVSTDEIAQKIPDLIKKNFSFELSSAKEDIKDYSYSLEKLFGYHLSSLRKSRELLAPANKSASYILIMIASGILLLACFNYINMMIGNYYNRLKEMGLRKVVGAKKIDLVKQVVTESILILVVTFLIGMLLAGILLPNMQILLDKTLSISYLLSFDGIIILFLLVLAVCAISCVYPVLILSKIQVANIIKGNQVFMGKQVFSRVLIVAQFVVTLILIAATILIAKQRNFIQNKDLGYNPKNIMLIGNPDPWKNADIIKSRLMKLPGVVSASAAFGKGGGLLSDNGRAYLKLEKNGLNVDVGTLNISYDYLNTIGITVQKGRDFSREYNTDIRFSAIVNESFLKTFNESNPIGKHISQIAPIKSNYFTSGQDDPLIIGVVKDFHIASLSREVKPLVITIENRVPLTSLIVRLNSSENNANVIQALKGLWDEISPKNTLNYSFLDDKIAAEYLPEEKWNKIFGYATIIAIAIATMGVLAMCLFTLNRKKKEISIRKVLGAEIRNLYFLLSKEYMLLIGISCLVSWPIAYHYANIWLENYAYKTSFGFDTILVSLLLILFLVMLTISSNILKSARANPVDSLRSE